MKILFIFYISSGGVETLNRQRYAALKSKGIESHFLYLQRGSGQQNIGGMISLVLSDDADITALLKKENYDAVISCSIASILQVVKEALTETPVIYEIQGIGGDIITFFHRNKANIHRYADAILYPKSPIIDKTIHDFFPEKKKYTFHNCFNMDDFQMVETAAKKNRTLPIIGWVGRLEDNKNWRSFLKLLHLLVNQYQPNVRVWLFHDATLATTEELQAFREQVQHLDLSQHLTVFSNVRHNKMPYYYSYIAQSGGLICSTSRQEGFGYAIVEAMACQCPVLATDSDGVRAFIVEGETGMYFQHDNEQEGAAKTNTLLSNPVLRNEITEKAYVHIQKITDPETYAWYFQLMLSEVTNM